MLVRKGLFAAFAIVALLFFCTPVYAAEGDANAKNPQTEVFVSVTDTVVAHTAMDNPVKYSLVPESAADSAHVSVSYRAIKSLADAGVEVAVPKDIGKYLVYIEVEFDDPQYFCAGKYLVYEIAEKSGASLSESEALKSVPREFTASIGSVSATYSVSYNPPDYFLNVAGVRSRLMYSHIYANGTTGDYTEELPTEPGDYIISCFVLNTVVGTSRLVIDKLTPQIIMDDASFTHTPSGIYPAKASVLPAGIELEYKAYTYENGVVGKSVDFPLKDCGTYLISACPADTAHYSFTLSYCYVTINKIKPVISAESLVYTEDGKAKELAVSVLPEHVEYSVDYYRMVNGEAVALENAPAKKGEYFAVVSVKKSAAVESATRVFGIRIVSEESAMQKFFRIALKLLCVATVLASVSYGGTQIYKAKRNKGEHVE